VATRSAAGVPGLACPAQLHLQTARARRRPRAVRQAIPETLAERGRPSRARRPPGAAETTLIVVVARTVSVKPPGICLRDVKRRRARKVCHPCASCRCSRSHRTDLTCATGSRCTGSAPDRQSGSVRHCGLHESVTVIGGETSLANKGVREALRSSRRLKQHLPSTTRRCRE